MGNKKSSKKVENYDFETLSDTGDLNKVCNFGIIPVGVLHNILLFLPPSSHLRMCLSCKFFKTVGNTSYFWEQYCQNTFRNWEISKSEAEKVGWKRYYFDVVNVLQKKNPEKKYKIIKKNVFSTVNGKWAIGENILSGEKVSIKIMDVGADKNNLETIISEVKMHRKLRHENIITFIESFHYKKELWIVFEKVASQMTKLLLKATFTDERYIATIIRKMLSALKYIHENRVLHRDLKSDILLICGDGSVKIADFELSYQLSSDGERRKSLIGTPYWMAPEVIKDSKIAGYSYSIDVWGLGIVLIELCDGEPPLLELSPLKVLEMIGKNFQPSLRDDSRWSTELMGFLRRCLERDVEKRANVDELLRHPFLEKALESTGFLVTYLDRYNLRF